MNSDIISTAKDIVQLSFSVWVAIYLITTFRKSIDSLKEIIIENTNITKETKNLIERIRNSDREY